MQNPTTPLMMALSALLATSLASADVASTTADPGTRADRFPISLEAEAARRAERFSATDTDNDGLVSAAEFTAHLQTRSHGRGHRNRLHTHRSGVPRHPDRHRAAGGAPLDTADLDAKLFRALDSDGDGLLAASEFSLSSLAAARQTLRQSELFTRLDADASGYLSAEEFPPSRLAKFDADGNGEISRDELPRPHHRRQPGPEAG